MIKSHKNAIDIIEIVIILLYCVSFKRKISRSMLTVFGYRDTVIIPIQNAVVDKKSLLRIFPFLKLLKINKNTCKPRAIPVNLIDVIDMISL